MQRHTAVLQVVAASFAFLSFVGSAGARPGDLIAYLTEPGSLAGFAYDPTDDTYWFARNTILDPALEHYDGTLTRRLDTFPVDGISALGVAYNSIDDTLLVAVSASIVEIGKDGVPTGRVIDDIPPPDGIPVTHTVVIVLGLAYDARGDDGRGSVYAILNGFEGAQAVRELAMDGRVLRSFVPHEIVHDLDLIHDGEQGLAGFYLTSADFYSRGQILRLDMDGTCVGVTIPTHQIGGSPFGIARRSVPHPIAGVPVDAFIVTSHDGRVALLEGGEPEFLRIHDAMCELDRDTVTLSWKSPQEFDSIEVLDHGEVIDALPGAATQWVGDLEDGLHELTLRSRWRSQSRDLAVCSFIIGPGTIVGEVEVDPVVGGLTHDGDGRLVVIDPFDRQFVFVDELQVESAVTISNTFSLEQQGSSPVTMNMLARGPGLNTLVIFNIRTGRVGGFDQESGDQIGEFLADPSIRGARSMSFFDRGDGGNGSLLILRRDRDAGMDLITEMDFFGAVLREIAHPYSLFNREIDEGRSRGKGISVVEGSDPVEVFLDGRRHCDRLDTIFRMYLTTGEVVPGSEITHLLPDIVDLQHVSSLEGERLFALVKRGVTRRTIEEMNIDRPAVVPPSCFECRQTSLDDDVELTFDNGGESEFLEISRDAEIIAVIDGASTMHIDRGVSPGIHAYSIRGLRGKFASSSLRCELRVGAGAILLSRPDVATHQNIDRDPFDGSFYLLDFSGRTLDHFDADLVEHDASRNLTSVAMTFALGQIDGEHRLFFIHATAEAFELVVESLNATVVSRASIEVPKNSRTHLKGLVWNEATGTLFFQDVDSDTFYEMTVEGEILRSFANPDPTAFFLTFDGGMAYHPSRETLFLLGSNEGSVWVDYAAEMRTDGSLTGVRIPIPNGGAVATHVYDIVFESDDVLVAVGDAHSRAPYGTEIVKLKVGPLEAPDAPFRRGDSNGGGSVDISDAIRSLLYLFQGGAAPQCADAMDFTDDGRLDVSDPIATLNFLFVGGSPPAPPGNLACGADPTEDSLDCSSYRCD